MSGSATTGAKLRIDVPLALCRGGTRFRSERPGDPCLKRRYDLPGNGTTVLAAEGRALPVRPRRATLHLCGRIVHLKLTDGVHLFFAQSVDAHGRKSRVARVQIAVKLTVVPTAESFPVGHAPVYVAEGAGAVWTTNLDGTVSRVELSTGKVAATIAVDPQPSGIAYGDGSVWVGCFATDVLARIDPTTNTVVARIHVGTHPFGAAFGPDGSVWVSDDDGFVYRIDPATNAIVVSRVEVGGQAEITAYGFGRVWSTNQNSTVTAIDPATNRVVGTVTVSHDVDDISLSGDAVYASTFYAGVIARIDPSTMKIAPRRLPLGDRLRHRAPLPA